jgi:hypothetical protein
MSRFVLASLIAAWATALCGPAWGQLLSPGQLARPHAELEGLSNCTKCHSAGDQISRDQCLECHDKLAARIRDGLGYHSQVQADCISCHSDHRGADYGMVRWSVESFDHDSTGYVLTGKHRAARCDACHQQPATYLGLSQRCLSCHADQHRGQLGADCLPCHGFDGWKPATFEHGRARFALQGKHIQVSCQGCHVPALDDTSATYTRYRDIPYSACSDCHNDYHRGQFQEDCATCHSADGWKPVPVDHQRTRFPLLGGHAKVTCVACHGPRPADGDVAIAQYRGLEFARCQDCHADYHRGQFSEDCAACHAVAGWKTVPLDHDQTRYPLLGRHAQVSCAACHGPRPEDGSGAAAQYRGLEFARCRSCHADYHHGQFHEDCVACHSVTGWKLAAFDHEKTRYPLVGKHVSVPCDRCHPSEQTAEGVTFTRLRGLDFQACRNCHPDQHAGQFEKDCAGCHTALGWKLSPFDHRGATFQLDGAHVDVPCQACHPLTAAPDGRKLTRYRPVPGDCASCHG